jgi:flagellar hook-associated protein 1 FlgK
LGGQSVLVLGDKSHPLQADITNSGTVIRSDAGDDVTNLVTGGKLKALVTEKNTTFPGYTADQNTHAASFADNVNTALANGVDRNGLSPTANLFTYTPGSAASSLATNNLSPDEIAAASASNPGGNDNALAVSQLATAQVTNGLSFNEAFGNLGAKVGRDSAAAKADSTQFQDTLAQARTFRSAETGVSLDEEAAKLLQLQQSYQAVGKLISVLSSLTDTVLGIIH